MASESPSRLHRAWEALKPAKIDCLIVSAPPNIRYLTGFTGSNALVLVWNGGAALFTDPRYAIQAARETSGCTVRVARGALQPVLMKLAKRKRFRRIGFEQARLTYSAYENLREKLTLGASLHPVAGLVDTLRMVKSPREIDLIRRSVLLNSQAYERAIRKVRPGITTESALAARIEYEMRVLGAEKPAFDTIVASGSRTALPHAQPTAGPVANNQLLLIDMGASREGYASDMTRMAFAGRPGPKVRAVYRAVLEAQLAAIGAVKPGVTAGSVDRAARRVLRAAGMERAFVHSTGHGLGLEIHEGPRLGRQENTPLAEGMAITIEPGAYFEGFGGIRIEDTVVVTSSGCEVLTPTSKELLLLE
ncbi:MAG: M24 family metallopeptidase [Acidobacteriota bacterium]